MATRDERTGRETGMDMRTMRQRCEARLRTLALPQPFDVRSFCDLLAASRGRAILFSAMMATGDPCGLWVAGPSLDVIFYERETSGLHQEHIILHEVCHLLCEHHPVPLPDSHIAQLLCPQLDATAVHRVLQRNDYSTEEECEAEVLASLILDRIAERPSHNGQLGAEVEGVLGRLATSLEHPTSG